MDSHFPLYSFRKNGFEMVSRKNHNESFENLDSTSALFSTLKRKCKTHRGHANTAQKKLNVCFHHSNTLFLFFLCKMDKFNQVNERSQNSIKKKTNSCAHPQMHHCKMPDRGTSLWHFAKICAAGVLATL